LTSGAFKLPITHYDNAGLDRVKAAAQSFQRLATGCKVPAAFLFLVTRITSRSMASQRQY
jgi:hypothetical protein